MAISKLKVKDLYNKCDYSKFKFENTTDVEEKLSALGQDRALSAVELGININSRGYNLFCFGPEGTGKTSLVKKVLKLEAKNRETPDDIAYIYNYDEPHKPSIMRFPAGTATNFAKEVDKMIEELSIALPAIVDGEEYKAAYSIIKTKYHQKKEEYIDKLRKKIKGRRVTIIEMPIGLVVAPMKDGEVLSPEAFDALPESEKVELMNDLNAMQIDIENDAHDAPSWDEKEREEIHNLKSKFVKITLKKVIDNIKDEHKNSRVISEFLKNVQKHILENVEEFTIDEEEVDNVGEGEEDALSSLFSRMNRPQEENFYAKFKINVIVKNEPKSGAPIVHLDHPTQSNLMGKIEKIQQHGSLISDFTMIKSGAIHEANGGFLLIEARKLLVQPYAWDSLKRALASKEVKIEAPGDDTGYNIISMSPEAIPLDIKIILVGDEELYELLMERDPDFSDYFKVEADFASVMDRSSKIELEYAKLIDSLSNKKKIRSLNPQAVGRVIEYSSRLAGDSKKLTAHISSISDLLKEADYWARKSKANQIAKKHIDKAIESASYRGGRVKQMMLEQISKGSILLDVVGSRVGQINGLVVYSFSRNSFGKPTRITTQVRLGKGEFLDIEREVELSGPIHSKGVLILQALLANRFAKDAPLSLSASIVFEQSYGGVDGDSASSTEYYCLLSAIAGIPIKQSIAVTGSINQFGEIQPIGGVNEKIEGFFDVCTHEGLTGDQGVIIPRTNVTNLVLRSDVVEAVENGKFHIYAIDSVDDGIEVLTGLKAGVRDSDGNFPKGSVNFFVQEAIAQYYKKYVYYARETHGSFSEQ